MSRKRLRRITVNGVIYLWAFRPGYAQRETAILDYQCRDEFIAYVEGYKNSPVRIGFATWESPISGGPLRDGSPLSLGNNESLRANLNTPGSAAQLIRLARKRGWQAEIAPLRLADGVALLMEDFRHPEGPRNPMN